MTRHNRRANRSTQLAIVGAGVAAIAALALFNSRTKRRVDLIARGREALDKTEKEAKETLKSYPEKVDKGLERFQKLFEDFRPQAVSDASRWLYAPGVYFNDGFVELKGSDALARYLGRSAEMTAELKVDVEEVLKSDNGVYVRWSMTFTTKSNLTVVAPGISHLRFNPDGRITYHRDFWDAGSALAELVPFAGAMLRGVKACL